MGIRNYVLATLFVIAPLAAIAKELQYFENKIDFWGENTSTSQGANAPPTTTVERNEKAPFPWKNYLDPKNKEFFKEGDYTPPEPFMEIARDPSDENLKNWFEFMKKKNELAARLQSRMQEYLSKTDGPKLAEAINTLPTSEKPTDNMKTEQQPVAQQPSVVDPSRFRIRMYFDSHCPHCKRMFAVIKRLHDEGFQVEALQVDDGAVPEIEKVVPMGKADLTDLKKHDASGVPFMLVADMKRKVLLPKIEGYHEYEEVTALLRAASRR